jgi:hypothetical protein
VRARLGHLSVLESCPWDDGAVIKWWGESCGVRFDLEMCSTVATETRLHSWAVSRFTTLVELIKEARYKLASMQLCSRMGCQTPRWASSAGRLVRFFSSLFFLSTNDTPSVVRAAARRLVVDVWTTNAVVLLLSVKVGPDS